MYICVVSYFRLFDKIMMFPYLGFGSSNFSGDAFASDAAFAAAFGDDTPTGICNQILI